ncbi:MULTISPECIES: hypothetical protein [unclassified Bradyrhizobium]
MTRDRDNSVSLTDDELENVAGAGVASTLAKSTAYKIGGIFAMIGGIVVKGVGMAVRSESLTQDGRELMAESSRMMSVTDKNA